MHTTEEILEKAQEGYHGTSELNREIFANGFLAQWVYQLEQELNFVKKQVVCEKDLVR